ncbi:hypothetical protein GPJ56_000479 [Histomonas meleagridis]|uniref:uncharacterized protein n=1 Tax=Histomonas meleagridis TaxID=135588 RepID=UPI003559A154|nr:hypothetical protein GPJ56_000479 [Histomonas meleagridis]KAH0796482.1 hypothetical protein GO595_010375 [Histomonas meleagridis]
MSSPALLAFAQKDQNEGGNDTICKYLYGTGFTVDEVKNWGKIGSLIEALNEDDDQPCHGKILGDEFIEFVANLPPGNTPRPIIRHQMQRPPPI